MEAADSRPEGTAPSVPISSGQGMKTQLQDVHFEYPSRPGQPVLCGVNLNIQAGQFCALAGSSGSGKSTIFAMLERFYRPDRGAVLMDGTDITRQLGTEFRDDIALVPQENVLFGDGSGNSLLGLLNSVLPVSVSTELPCISQEEMVMVAIAQTSASPGTKTREIQGLGKEDLCSALHARCRLGRIIAQAGACHLPPTSRAAISRFALGRSTSPRGRILRVFTAPQKLEKLRLLACPKINQPYGSYE